MKLLQHVIWATITILSVAYLGVAIANGNTFRLMVLQNEISQLTCRLDMQAIGADAETARTSCLEAANSITRG
jgi:hypothetical protein